jgi:MFS family permease
MNVELKLNRFMGTVSFYSVVTLVFFTTYIVFQPPATVIVRYLGPRTFLSFIVVAWGAVMIGMGFSDSFETLAALRVVLGILEAGFFPSCVYLLSTWYTRFDIGKRYSVFYILGSLASACAGILAYGLMQLKGRQGLNGWRWIFIIEGALTCFLGIAAYWMLVDFPDKAHMSWKFLTQREAKFIIDRVDRDRGDAKPEPWNLKKFLRGGADIKIWGFAMVSVPPMLLRVLQLTSSDLLQHNNRHIRSCVLPPNHPDREHGLLHRRVAMSCCSTIRARSDRYVRDWLGR